MRCLSAETIQRAGAIISRAISNRNLEGRVAAAGKKLLASAGKLEGTYRRQIWRERVLMQA